MPWTTNSYYCAEEVEGCRGTVLYWKHSLCSFFFMCATCPTPWVSRRLTVFKHKSWCLYTRRDSLGRSASQPIPLSVSALSQANGRMYAEGHDSVIGRVSLLKLGSKSEFFCVAQR